MANVITTNTIFNGDRILELNITNKSDGTEQVDDVFIDASMFTTSGDSPLSHFSIEEIQWSSQGYSSIKLAFDATSNVNFALLSANGFKTWIESGGLSDPKDAGFTGDIIVTTEGAVATATYDITIRLKKHR